MIKNDNYCVYFITIKINKAQIHGAVCVDLEDNM